jgi:transcriptional regulator with XRE-family HTH domain
MAKRKKTEVMEWLDGVLADPALASAVEERLAEMKIEQELVALREKEGLSQRDLAIKIGTSQPYIAKLESGRVQNLGLKTLARYAAATGTRLTVSFEPIQHHRKPASRRQAATVRARRLRGAPGTSVR